MTFRNELEALSQRAAALEADLADANEQLADARQKLVSEAERDEERERRLADLEGQVNDLRKKLGLQPLQLSREKKETPTWVLLLLIFVPVLLAIGVALMGLMTPEGEDLPRAFPLLVGGVFALFGLPMIGLALSAFGKDRDIARWPKAKGRVESSGVESYTCTEKDRYGYYRPHTAFTPRVSYTYTVDGNELLGSAVARVEESTTNEATVEATVERYPAGAEVMVFYDPDDPSTAYLEVRRSVGAIILLCFGLGLTAIGVGVGSIFFS